MAKKLVIDNIKQFIKENYDLELLNDGSNFYSLLLRCKNGHTFKRSIWNLKGGKLCAKCLSGANRKEKILKILKEKHPGSQLLSNCPAHIFSVQCEKGHIFNTEMYNLESGRWCKECVSPAVTEDRINRLLRENHPEAKLLLLYVDDGVKYLKLKCEKGHEFKIRWNKFNVGEWCMQCWKDRRYSTEEKFIKLLDEMHPGSRLISEYKNVHGTVNVICENGHQIETSYVRVKRGNWCAECEGRKKITIEYIREFVKETFDGKCLSEEYDGCDNHLEFECKCGNRFKQTWFAIKDGKKSCWCHLCRDVMIPNIEFIKNYVKENFDGYCLEDKYTNYTTIMRFKCNKGHEFDSCWKEVKNSRWCTECFAKRRKPTLEEIDEFVKSEYGGKLLSKSYESAKSKLFFLCEKGHKFDVSWDNLKRNGRWCRHCRGGVRKNLNDIKKYVDENYNGKCLEVKYKNQDTKMIFSCEKNHEFERTWREIKRDIWCSRCYCNTGEGYCRSYFENRFGKEFPKLRPEWLTNEEGNRLELDGFCKELGLAFEYDGRQHFEIVEAFNMTEEDLEKRKLFDKIKDKKCKEMGITLIRIPQFDRQFTKNMLEEFLEKKFKELNLCL